MAAPPPPPPAEGVYNTEAWGLWGAESFIKEGSLNHVGMPSPELESTFTSRGAIISINFGVNSYNFAPSL